MLMSFSWLSNMLMAWRSSAMCVIAAKSCAMKRWFDSRAYSCAAKPRPPTDSRAMVTITTAPSIRVRMVNKRIMARGVISACRR
jgi:hypothetical protein